MSPVWVQSSDTTPSLSFSSNSTNQQTNKLLRSDIHTVTKNPSPFSPTMQTGYSNGYGGGHTHSRRRSHRAAPGGVYRVCSSSLSSPSTAPSTPTTTSYGNSNHVDTETAVASMWEGYDEAYFQSYANVGIHQEMIKDRVRTDTYKAAIMHHQNLISGKVVMDVGCGTGILSIFCAQAGASRVYAIEASDIAIQANEIVKENDLSDRITVIHSRVEEVEIEEKVDVIISEWMGYALLYETMLPSVLYARDKWLKPGGLILPSHAMLYMAPVTNSERYHETIDFWRNVYGIDMSALIPLAKQCAFEEPVTETISGENVLTWPFMVKYIDCYTTTARELESITARYKLSAIMSAPLHGFAFWFEVEFNGPITISSNNDTGFPFQHGTNNGSNHRKRRQKDTVVLSTAPEETPTHWQQTILYFYEPIEVRQDQIIEGSITLSQSKENHRFMNVHLEYSTGGRSFVKESVMR
ncbi:Protein arginine methyltransferase 6 [Rhynchospora pubera]|uniref:Protein arginine methyltransferase 6 n=1 Tax=Rhynchospora pubera TaxID=906938 RepID=A0AAV8EB48_9POAL|nr:Protein arginine methyltransferase 6 [Rhynchospora pubera]